MPMVETQQIGAIASLATFCTLNAGLPAKRSGEKSPPFRAKAMAAGPFCLFAG
jgi:hypothetical protein